MKEDVAATVPSEMTTLRLLLTLPCGVASGDRSFSMLKGPGVNIARAHCCLMPDGSQQLLMS